MMRLLMHVLFAIFLSLIETSFFASFHGVVRFTPFVLVVSVYLLQHHAMRSTAYWMVIHGLLIDVSGSSLVPFVTIAYIAAAWIAVLSAERLFSNRSFYGVVACACLSYVTFEFVSGVLQGFHAFVLKHPFHSETFFTDAFSRFLMLLVFLVLLFSFAKQIRSLLVKLSLLSPLRQTY